VQSNKSFFQKFSLQISITMQSEMNYGKIIMIVCGIRWCEGLYHDLEKSG